MIIYYLLQLLIFIGTSFTNVFGRADILPFGTDVPMALFFGWIEYIVRYSFWPLQTLRTVFIIYVGWRISVLVIRLVLGSRSPVN